jgi:hypothetical protein
MYTGLRVALLIAIWLLVQAITPLRGLMAVAVAIVISGVISFIVLDRSRDRASVGLAGFFKRIDDRIERSRTAEDVDDPPAAPSSGKGNSQSQHQAIDEREHTGRLQDGHERTTASPLGDGYDGSHSEGGSEEAEPRGGETEPPRQ